MGIWKVRSNPTYYQPAKQHGKKRTDIFTTKILPLVHAIEIKYGSISQAPDNDENFIKLHALCGCIADNHQTVTLSFSQDFVQQHAKAIPTICQMAQNGYSIQSIEKELKLSYQFIRFVYQKYHIVPKPIFAFQLKKDGKKTYVSTRNTIQKLFNLPYYRPINSSVRHEFGYDIHRFAKGIRLSEVPTGATIIYTKKGKIIKEVK